MVSKSIEVEVDIDGSAYAANKMAEAKVRATCPDMQLRTSLTKWRREHGFSAGFIVVNGTEICGYTRDLLEPRGWRPGCIAFDNQGKLRGIAVGGNAYDGAANWEPNDREGIH